MSGVATGQWQADQPLTETEVNVMQALNEAPWKATSQAAADALGGVLQGYGDSADSGYPGLLIGSTTDQGTLAAWSLNRMGEFESATDESLPLPHSYAVIRSASPQATPPVSVDFLVEDDSGNPVLVILEVTISDAVIEFIALADAGLWEGVLRGEMLSFQASDPVSGEHTRPIHVFLGLQEFDPQVALMLPPAGRLVPIGGGLSVMDDDSLTFGQMKAGNRCHALFNLCVKLTNDAWREQRGACHAGTWAALLDESIQQCQLWGGVGLAAGGLFGGFKGAVIFWAIGCAVGVGVAAPVAVWRSEAECLRAADVQRSIASRGCVMDLATCMDDARFCIWPDPVGGCPH